MLITRQIEQAGPTGRVDVKRHWVLRATIVAATFLLAASGFSDAQAVAATPTCSGKPATIIGTDLGDSIVGTAGNDVIVGLGGGDVIDGAGGDDYICGGDGNDVLKGGAGQDTIDGGAGNDSIDGGDATDRCVLADRDALSTCETTGPSMFALTGATDGSPSTPAAPAPTCNGKPATIVGTEMGDVLTGTPGDDVIVGLGGGDVIDGGGGNDTICGGNGRDQITGGTGTDWIDGGADADNLMGGADADTIFGGEGDDVLSGEGGNDVLDGGLGRDSVDGGADQDIVVGGGGNDALTGGPGDDVLDGGPGLSADRDALNGQDGNDACTSVTALSTSESCEGLAKLIGPAGGSITHAGTTMTVPSGLLIVQSYAAIRHEVAGDRVTKKNLVGTFQFVDLYADWKGRGKVTLSMPFDATSAGQNGTVPAVYRVEDDGTVAALENVRLSPDRTRVEFDTTALSMFAPGAKWPCAAPPSYIPALCVDIQSRPQPSAQPMTEKDKAAVGDAVNLVVGCGLGVVAILVDPVVGGEAAMYASCFAGMIAQTATPSDLPTSQKRAIDCASSAVAVQTSGLGSGWVCAIGMATGAAGDVLTTIGCKAFNCTGMDAAVQQQRDAAAAARARAAAPPSTPVPLPSQPPTSNYNPQPPTYNPQPPTYNPQPPTYNPQQTYNPQP